MSAPIIVLHRPGGTGKSGIRMALAENWSRRHAGALRTDAALSLRALGLDISERSA